VYENDIAVEGGNCEMNEWFMNGTPEYYTDQIDEETLTIGKILSIDRAGNETWRTLDEMNDFAIKKCFGVNI
jgi:hypothetical protein